jgi:hypothetical protein
VKFQHAKFYNETVKRKEKKNKIKKDENFQMERRAAYLEIVL